MRRLALLLALVFAVPGYSTTHVELVGSPPAPYTLEWRQWYQELLAAREAECDFARTDTYYISNSGNSGNSGTIGSPKTYADINGLISGAPAGGVSILLNRGEEYNATILTQIFISGKDKIHIGAYGTGPKPYVHCFNYELDTGSDWTDATPMSGDRWTTTVSSEVACIRDKTSDDTRLSPYRYMNSTAGVEATPRSWYWASNTLHINAGEGVDPNSIDYEYSLDSEADGSGLLASGSDQLLIENLRVDGFGCTIGATDGDYCFKIASNTVDERTVVRDCEGHYGGRHVFGSTSALGPTTWIRCVGGGGRDTTNNYTNFVTYAPDLTGVEAIYDNCIAWGGEYPETGTAGPEASGTQAFLAHDNPGTTACSLFIMYNCSQYAPTHLTNWTAPAAGMTIRGVAFDSDVNSLRTYIVDYRCDQSTNCPPTFASNCVWINPFWRFVLTSGSGTMSGLSTSGGHVYNGVFAIHDPQLATRRTLLASNGASTTKFTNTTFRFSGTTTAADSVFNGYTLNYTGGSSTAFFKNCLFLRAGDKQVFNNLGNNSTYFLNCAGYQTSTDATLGFASTPGWVALADGPDMLGPPNGTALEGAGADDVLEFDQHWQRRPVTGRSIGAVEAISELDDSDTEKLDTILARIGPWTGDTDKNSVYGALRAIANSDAGFSSADLTKDDGDGAGSFDNETDSLLAGRSATSELTESFGVVFLKAPRTLSTAAGGSTSTVVLEAGASTEDGAYAGDIFIDLVQDENRRIVSYDGDTLTATFDRPFPATTNGTAYLIKRGAAATLVDDAITADTIATDAIAADAVASDVGQEFADSLLDRTDGIETGWTLRQVMRIMAAAIAGKTTVSGGTATFRDLPDTKARITTTISGGQRSAQTYDKD